MRVVNWARWAAAAATITIAAAMPASALTLPFGLGGTGLGSVEREGAAERPAEPPVRYAQAGDPLQRINQLEEDNRRLNGRVEELSFQLLQMQEQLRKLQEDNEFRFQELEGARAGGGASGGQRTDASRPAATPGAAPAATETAGRSAPSTGAPPAGGNDEIGSLLGGGLDTSGLGAPGEGAGTLGGSGTVAAVTPSRPGELYALAYNYLLAGDYQLAENSFRQYAQTYPDAADVPDAEYWLGESLFQQAKFTDAAETFLKAQKDHPKSPKAPEMMLKLGMSLAKLDNRETACVTFREVGKRYPQMSANVKKKLQSETAAANC